MAGFPIEVATRIKTLPPYLFAAIDKMKQAAIARGVDIINLGIGDPDLPTPAPIIESLAQAAKNPETPSVSRRMKACCRSAKLWPIGINADSASRWIAADEVLTLIGSKEGIGHIHLAFVDPGNILYHCEPLLSGLSGRHEFQPAAFWPHDAAHEGERFFAGPECDPERGRKERPS